MAPHRATLERAGQKIESENLEFFDQLTATAVRQAIPQQPPSGATLLSLLITQSATKFHKDKHKNQISGHYPRHFKTWTNPPPLTISHYRESFMELLNTVTV